MILGDPNRREEPAQARPAPKPCRNCGGTELYSQTVNARHLGYLDLLPIGLLQSHYFRLEVCGGCGLVNWFVPDALLPAVKEKFSKE
jgi:hypothetical protein